MQWCDEECGVGGLDRVLDSYFKHLKKSKGDEGYIVQPDGLVGGNLCKAIKQLALVEQVLLGHQLLEVLS